MKEKKKTAKRGFRKITVRHDDDCLVCSQIVNAGERVIWIPQTGVLCVECSRNSAIDIANIGF